MIISVTNNKLLTLAKENKAVSIKPFSFNEESAIKTYISSKQNGGYKSLLYVDANNNYYLEERDK